MTALGTFGVSAPELILLVVAALGAGGLDAMVGSGSIVQLPVLLMVFGTGAAAVPLSINKSVAALGNVASAGTFWRRNPAAALDRGILIVAGLTAVPGVIIGALVSSHMDVSLLRPLAIVALVGVVIYSLWLQPRLRLEAGGRPPRLSPAGGASFVIGVYDGIIGPATGTLLLLTFQRFLRRRLVDTLGSAKIIQLTLNATGAAVLAQVAPINVALVAAMGLANMLGSAVGSRVVLRLSDRVVRLILIATAAATLGKLCLA